MFIFTKSRHIYKISKFLDGLKLDNKIFTIHDSIPNDKFDLGVSYCYPRKILPDLLYIPKKGFINYHPHPLPEYKGLDSYENAVKDKVSSYGVSVHYMDEEYDTGKIIKVDRFELHEPPTSVQELGAITHFFLFNLFKKTLLSIYNNETNSRDKV